MQVWWGKSVGFGERAEWRIRDNSEQITDSRRLEVWAGWSGRLVGVVMFAKAGALLPHSKVGVGHLKVAATLDEICLIRS